MQVVASGLRAALGDEAIVSGAGGYALRWPAWPPPTARACSSAAPDAHRTHAELLRAHGRGAEAASAVRRALELDEAKANVVAAATTRRRFAELLR